MHPVFFLQIPYLIFWINLALSANLVTSLPTSLSRSVVNSTPQHKPLWKSTSDFQLLWKQSENGPLDPVSYQWKDVPFYQITAVLIFLWLHFLGIIWSWFTPWCLTCLLLSSHPTATIPVGFWDPKLIRQLAPSEKLNWAWKSERSALNSVPYRQHGFTPHLISVKSLPQWCSKCWFSCSLNYCPVHRSLSLVESLPFGQPAHHFLQVRRMWGGLKQTNFGSQLMPALVSLRKYFKEQKDLPPTIQKNGYQLGADSYQYRTEQSLI